MKKKLSIIFIVLVFLSACKKKEDPEPDKNTPIARDDSYSITANTDDNALHVLDNDIDPNGDDLDFKDISMDRTGGIGNVLDPVTGKRYLSYSPGQNVVGIVNIYYTIYDAEGNSSRAHVTVDVGNTAQKVTWAIMGNHVNQYVYLNNLSSKSLYLSDEKVTVTGTDSPVSNNDSWLLLSDGKLYFSNATTSKTFTVSSFTPSAGTAAFKLVPDDNDDNTALSYLYYRQIW